MAFTKRQQQELIWLEAEELTGIPHGFSTRLGGVSKGHLASLNLRSAAVSGDEAAHVEENYRRLCRGLSMEVTHSVLARQVHQDTVRLVTKEDWGKGVFRPCDYEADALITREKDTPLFVFSADCIITLLYDPVEQAIGAVHAGWRGTAKELVKKTVLEMAKVFGTKPENVIAAIGPGICQTCFETFDDVPDAMTAAMGQEAAPFIRPFGEKWQVDLKGLNRRQLELCGVRSITVSEASTCCDSTLFWSHRKMGEQRGVQCGVIALR